MPSAARKKPTTGSQAKPLRGPIKIQVNRQVQGTTYALDDESRRAIAASFPGVRAVPTVYVSTETESDFEEIHGKIWNQIALVLTGLPSTKLRELGVVLIDPFSKQTVKKLYS